MSANRWPHHQSSYISLELATQLHTQRAPLRTPDMIADTWRHNMVTIANVLAPLLKILSTKKIIKFKIINTHGHLVNPILTFTLF